LQGTVNSSAGAVVTTLERDAEIYYLKSGVVSKTNACSDDTVASGEKMRIYGGGTIRNLTASAGAEINGFVMTSDTVFASRFEISGYQISGASGVYLYDNQTMNRITLLDGGNAQISGGEVASAQVSSGGIMNVSGGVADRTTIYGNGSATVLSGGEMTSTTVQKDAKLTVGNSGTASVRTAVMSGGSLAVTSGGSVTGVLTIQNGATVSFTDDSTFNFDISNRTTEDPVLISNVTYITGNPHYTLTVDANQAVGDYKLANGADEFLSTIEVLCDGKRFESIAVDDECETEYGYFKLSNQAGVLTLTVRNNAIASVTSDPSGPTRDNVTVTATFSETATNPKYRVGEVGEWQDYTQSVTVTDNCAVYFKATNSQSKEVIRSFIVDNIDRVPPAAPFNVKADITAQTNTNVTVTADFASDSVLNEYKIGSGEWTSYADGVIMTENGTVSFRSTDAVGNVSEVTDYDVTNIDKVAPTVTNIVVTPSGLTNTDVSVTADYADNVAIQTRRYKIGSGAWQNYTGAFTVTNNAELTFEAVDTASNKTEVTYTVSNIDKEKPVMVSVTANTTDPAYVVILTAAATDNVAIGKYQYRIGTTGDWTDSTSNQISITQNGTVYVRAVDTAGNISDNEKSIVISNVDPTLKPVVPHNFEVHDTTASLTINWEGSAACTYQFRYADSIDKLTGEGESLTVATKAFDPATLVTEKTYYYQVCAVSVLEEVTDWSYIQTFSVHNSISAPTVDPASSEEGSVQTGWQASTTPGMTYTAQYTNTTTGKTVQIDVSKNKVNVIGLDGNYSWRAAESGSERWTEGTAFESTVEDEPVKFASTDATADDAFFARTDGTFSGLYSAHNMVTGEYKSLSGMNKFTDMFAGGSDNISTLYLTDDGKDAFFLDDVYSDSANGEAVSNSRIANLNMIQAGAGDDLIDLTSTRFAESGRKISVHGGNDNDTIWGGNGNGSMLFGDLGNDTIKGGTGNDFIIGGAGNDNLFGNGGNDTFIFGTENWGTDAIMQTNGTVRLWFADGDASKWNASTMTYTDGDNSVTVSGVDADKVELKFGVDATDPDFAALADAGAFGETKDQKIYTTIA